MKAIVKPDAPPTNWPTNSNKPVNAPSKITVFN
jgi:hypothetical protein